MECVNIRNEGAVRIVEMDRPEAPNAFNGHMMDDLADAFLDAAADENVKVLVLTGVGAGIGMTIFGLADLIYMADDTRFRCPFSELGLTAEAASTMTFPRLLGRQRATWFLLSSEWISVNECVAAGLALEAFSDKRKPDFSKL